MTNPKTNKKPKISIRDIVDDIQKSLSEKGGIHFADNDEDAKDTKEKGQ